MTSPTMILIFLWIFLYPVNAGFHLRAAQPTKGICFKFRAMGRAHSLILKANVFFFFFFFSFFL
jgi:hypothetical protein